MLQHLHRDIESLKKTILSLGGRVEECVNNAIMALRERREDLARAVFQEEKTIDAAEVAIEEECLKLLALHQPVAQDLRFIVTVLKVNNDLERMADHAVSIARRALAARAMSDLEANLHIRAMGEKAREMVGCSLRALVTNDAALAARVLEADDEVDRMHRENYERVETLMENDPTTVRRAVPMLTVSRHLERIGDLATNICEDVIFMAKGDVIRHRA